MHRSFHTKLITEVAFGEIENRMEMSREIDGTSNLYTFPLFKLE